MRVLHLEQSRVAALDRAGHRDAVAFVKLLGQVHLVEPGDAQLSTAAVAEHGLGELHAPVAGDFCCDRGDDSDHGRLGPWLERLDLGRSAVRLETERKRENQVADSVDPELYHSLAVSLPM